MLQYKDIRSKIQAGDVIFWHPPAEGELSMERISQLIIAKFCNYSHASIVINQLDEPDRICVCESDFKTSGLVIRHLSKALEEQHGVMHWLPANLKQFEQVILSKREIDRARSGVIKYDTIGCVQKLLDIVLPKSIARATMHAQRIYCFGEVYQALMHVARVPVIQYAPTANDIIKAIGGEPVEVNI